MLDGRTCADCGGPAYVVAEVVETWQSGGHRPVQVTQAKQLVLCEADAARHDDAGEIREGTARRL